MRTVNIHDAKTQLSRLVEQAAKGESFIIAKVVESRIAGRIASTIADRSTITFPPLHLPGQSGFPETEHVRSIPAAPEHPPH